MTIGQKLHSEAGSLRESGQFVESLKKLDEAQAEFLSENNYDGFAEVQSARALCLRHLYAQTGEQDYLILAKYSAKSAVEICERRGGHLSIPYFNLAKVLVQLDQLVEARENYYKAVEAQTNNPMESHNRPAVLLDIKIHLGLCELKMGQGDSASVEKLITELIATDEYRYNKDVWSSGGYMGLAEIFAKSDMGKSQEMLNKASEIINSNPELVIRKKQLVELASKLSITLGNGN